MHSGSRRSVSSSLMTVMQTINVRAAANTLKRQSYFIPASYMPKKQIVTFQKSCSRSYPERWNGSQSASGGNFLSWLLSKTSTTISENTSSATSHSARLPSEYLLNSTIRLFHQIGQIFRENAAPPSNPMGIRIDSKRRKKLMQKRLAMGHKQDDHEQNYGQTLQ